MKISTILNERSGAINVPREAIDNVMNIVCSDFFSRAITYINELDDDWADLPQVYKTFLIEYRKKYGHFNLFPNFTFDKITEGSTVFRMSAVDPRYFSRNKNAKSRTYKLNVVVDVSDSDTKFAATFAKKKSIGMSATINIWLPSEERLKTIFKSPEIVAVNLERIEGYIEHELIHAIQDIALKQHDDTDETYVNGEWDEEKYYMSGIEFSPQILTAAKNFITYVKEFQSMGITFTKEKIKAHIMRYINPQSPIVAGVEFPDSEFLHVLYNKDKVKWKKAVKGFYDIIQNELKL